MRTALFLAAWAITLFGPFIVAAPEGADARRIPYVACILSSALLVALAWLTAPRRTAKGMTSGFVGDLCMALGALLPAMAAFGTGHVFYILAARSGIERRLSTMLAAAAWLAVGIAVWYAVVFLGEGPIWLRVATLVYCLLLAALAGAGSALFVTKPGLANAAVAIGAALFFASDAAIASRMFQPNLLSHLPDSIRADFVWLTYGPAQALLVLGLSRDARQSGRASSYEVNSH